MNADGFEVPLHRALTEPMLMGGAPRGLAILNGTLAAAIGLGLQLWIPGLIAWVCGHAACVYATRQDPQLLPVLARHVRAKAYLSC